MINQGNTLRQIYNALSTKLETADIVMTYVLTSGKTLTDLLPLVNKLYIDIGDETVQDENELQLVLEYWRNNFDQDFQYDLENLAELEEVHRQLEKLDQTTDPVHPKILYSPIKVDKVTIKAVPVLKSNNQAPTVDDALIIFDKSEPSYDVPYVRYNGEGDEKTRQEMFKLYQGVTDEKMPDYKIIIPPTSQTNKGNSLYMTVWSGKGTRGKATKESYMKGYYNIPTNTLTIKTPTEENINQNTIIQKIKETLPVNIDNVTETAISGEFFLFNLEVNDIYLVDMIINTDLMSSYLFVKETTTSYAEKTQLKIYYKSFTGLEDEDEENITEGYIANPSSVTVSLTQNRAQGGEVVNVAMADGITKFRLPPGLPYVKAKITQAESLDVANQFVKIFTLLMQYYVREKAETERLFLGYIPELNQQIEGAKPIEITVKPTKGRKKTGDSKIERLKEVGPDLFVSGYARKCQCIFQPIAIPPDEIDAWKNNTFLYKEVERQRQIMSFPPDNPKWNFVCPNDSAPFPGVKMNKDLSNKDTYPCVPCCFKDDQMDPKVFSNYNECFRGKKKKEEATQTKETHKIKTDKIIPSGRFG